MNDNLKIISWLPVVFIWLSVIAFLKEYYGFVGAFTGVCTMIACLFIYDLIRS